MDKKDYKKGRRRWKRRHCAALFLAACIAVSAMPGIAFASEDMTISVQPDTPAAGDSLEDSEFDGIGLDITDDGNDASDESLLPDEGDYWLDDEQEVSEDQENSEDGNNAMDAGMEGALWKGTPLRLAEMPADDGQSRENADESDDTAEWDEPAEGDVSQAQRDGAGDDAEKLDEPSEDETGNGQGNDTEDDAVKLDEPSEGDTDQSQRNGSENNAVGTNLVEEGETDKEDGNITQPEGEHLSGCEENYEDTDEDSEPAMDTVIPYSNRSLPAALPHIYPFANDDNELVAYFVNRFPPTRNQTTGGEHYGCCWAEAATALAEFYSISHDMSDKDGRVTRDSDYSETQLSYFCYNQAPAGASGETGDYIYLDTSKCGTHTYMGLGGNLDFAAQSLMHGNGYVKDAGKAAFSNVASILKDGYPDAYATEHDVARLKNEYVLSIRKNPELVKRAIINNGAVGTRYNSKPRFLNSATNAYYNYESTTINHVVVLVGWNDSFPASKFVKAPPGPGAWLARNSHTTNTRMSEESYFWISYYDTSIEEAAYVYEMAEQGDWCDNLYYYDGQLHKSVAASSNLTANVFMASKRRETLKAVQIDATKQALGDFAIDVYVNPEDHADPTSGDLVSHTEGFREFLGRYTIPLDTTVKLEEGDIFAIVVTSTGCIDREIGTVWKEKLHMVVTAGHMESFENRNGKWVDLANDTKSWTRGNLCIRAMTDTRSTLLGKVRTCLVTALKNTIRLTWDRVADAVEYRIQRIGIGTGGISIRNVAVVAGSVNSYTDTDVKMGMTYLYRITTKLSGLGENRIVSVVSRLLRPLWVTINAKAANIKEGKTKQLSVSPFPSFASTGTVTWSSSNTNVCTVSKSGKVKAVAPGTAKVRASTESGKSVTCTVTVQGESSIVLDQPKMTMTIGESVPLKASTISGGNVSVTWNSSDSSIAKVSSSGKVTGKRSGTCKVTATSSYGTTATCTVTVKSVWVYQCSNKKGTIRYLTSYRDKETLRKLKADGWTCEKKFRAAGLSGVKVYWVYNPKTKRYLHTTDRAYAQKQKKAGLEAGFAFYASDRTKDNEGIPIYCMSKGTSPDVLVYVVKKDGLALKKKGWTSQGIAWFAEPAPSN